MNRFQRPAFWQILVLLCLLASPVLSQSGAFPAKGDPHTAVVRYLAFGGLQRSYLLQSVASGGLHPVVIILHGGTETAWQVWAQTSLPTLGAGKFIVIAPNGVNNHWNDGRGYVDSGTPSTADDVGFLTALIAKMVNSEGGDPNAVFLVGISNGGFMTVRFACQAGMLLRAAASVAALLPEPQAANCAGKLPWLAMNGDHDPLIPFQGQPAYVDEHGTSIGALLSADASFAFFATKAGCGAVQDIVLLPDLDVSDNSRAELRRPQGCNLAQYVFHGAGHTWPGLRLSAAITQSLGGTNEDVDAGTALWAFFSSTAVP